jgi:hypothetical protein
MTNKKTQENDKNESDERNEAAVALANEFLSRATLGEALSQISLSAVLQLTQSRALQQAKDQVSEMDDKQVVALIEELAANQQQQAEDAASKAVDQVTSEPAKAS